MTTTVALLRQQTRQKIPGVLFCVAAAVAAISLNWLLPAVSPLLIAILLGVLVGNVWNVKQGLSAGITFSAKKLLRLGIVLLGLQISFTSISELGATVAFIAIGAVFVGFIFALILGRILRLSATQTLLIAAGFSICGAAAVAAVDGVLDRDKKEEETVTALALVVLCGTLMIFALPATAGLLGFSAQQTAIWAGAAVHEVAQVVAIGGSLSAAALAAAVVVKLTRVLMLAPIMAGVSLWYRRSAAAKGGKLPPPMPLFVACFITLVVIGSLVPLPQTLLSAAAYAQTVLLAAAMFALGLGVRLSIFKRISPAPVILAVATTIIIAAITAGGIIILL